jgi:predicted Ser/Thr protein kinase
LELIGRVLGGYRIEAELGRGGQAVVYRATQLSLQRVVALKVLSPQLGADEDFKERFAREGVSAASLEHPNVVPVYEAGEEDGLAFLAMKYVDGPSLESLIRLGGPMAPHRAMSILRQVADALDAAHEQGFVHRDVKPANILVGPGDHAYLTDFGLAQALHGARITQSGTWMGTLEYIAPEQIRGGEVTGAADRYALAVVAYELLTGRPPFAREDRTALLYAHLNDSPDPPSSVRPELRGIDAVLARGMAKDPDARYPSATALVDELAASLPAAAAGRAPTAQEAPAPVMAPPPGLHSSPTAPTVAGDAPSSTRPGPPPPGDPPRRRRARWVPWAIAGGGAAAVAAVIVAVVVASGGDGGPRTVTTFVGPPTTATAPTTAPAAGSPFPNALEAALITHVPSEIRGTCERTTAGARAPESIASIRCSIDRRGVYYEEFSGPAPMAAYYERTIERHAIARDSGDCSVRESVEGPYTQNGRDVGRVACFRVDGDPWMVWTHAGLNVASTLISLGDSQRQLYRSWVRAGPSG